LIELTIRVNLIYRLLGRIIEISRLLLRSVIEIGRLLLLRIIIEIGRLLLLRRVSALVDYWLWDKRVLLWYLLLLIGGVRDKVIDFFLFDNLLILLIIFIKSLLV
jgi:hypothetical protein